MLVKTYRNLFHTQNVWIPELRGIPIGKRGETVAEFNVKTPDSKIPTAGPEVIHLYKF